MEYKIYPENTRFIFTDSLHPELISEWFKNLNNTFIVIVMFHTPCLIYVCGS